MYWPTVSTGRHHIRTEEGHHVLLCSPPKRRFASCGCLSGAVYATTPIPRLFFPHECTAYATRVMRNEGNEDCHSRHTLSMVRGRGDPPFLFTTHQSRGPTSNGANRASQIGGRCVRLFVYGIVYTTTRTSSLRSTHIRHPQQVSRTLVLCAHQTRAGAKGSHTAASRWLARARYTPRKAVAIRRVGIAAEVMSHSQTDRSDVQCGWAQAWLSP